MSSSDKLIKKIAYFLEGVSLRSLLLSSKKISKEYRSLGKRAQVKEEDILAYLVTRMPATYAVLCRVFQELLKRIPDFSPDSLLDIGCGPGTCLWAIQDYFPTIKEAFCVEKEEYFLNIAKQLAEELSPHAHWVSADMCKSLPDVKCQLIVASYSLGEIPAQECDTLVEKLWEKSTKVLALIEPGTPRGFACLRRVRDQLLQKGAHLIAPCPHSNACPLSQEDWCHFSARLNRSSLHRRAKEAELNYEDEKFFYLLFSKEPVAQCASRIIRHPRKGKGHVHLTLCKPEGIKETIVTKKEGSLYPLAKKSHWGDEIALHSPQNEVKNRK